LKTIALLSIALAHGIFSGLAWAESASVGRVLWVTAQIRRCDEFQAWSADFLKKTWQLFKSVDGQTRNTCEFDGDPRPMEQRACRSGNTPGAYWGFTDPSGRWVLVSACVSAMTAQN
jgi:hypothetical protein